MVIIKDRMVCKKIIVKQSESLTRWTNLSKFYSNSVTKLEN